MTINKFIKYTSLLVLGIWMATNPGNAFAANEKVEKTNKETINRLMQKQPDGSRAEKGDLGALRKAKRAEIISLKSSYETKLNEFNPIIERLKNYSQEAGQYEASTGDKVKKVGKVVTAVGAAMMVIPGLGTAAGALVTGLGALTIWAGSTLNDPDQGRKAAEKWLGGGSYAATVEQIKKNALQIKFDESEIPQDAKSDADVQKMLSLIRDYNKDMTLLQNMLNDFLPDAARLDQLLEEYESMPTSLSDGQELYAYYQYAGVDEHGEKKYNIFYFVMDSDGSFKSIDGVTRGCIPLPAKLAESQSCIFCPLFKTLFTAVQNMSTKSYNALAQPLANVVLVAFSLVVAFMVLKNVSSFTKQDAPKFITELLVNIFKVLVAFYMLKNSNIVYNYIIGPILKAGFEFGSSLLFEKGSSYLASCKTPDLTNSAIIGVIPTYLYSNLDCFIKAVQAEVSVPQSIGSTLMCVARNAGKENVGPVRNLLWDFSMMFQGLAIWVMGWIMSLAFAFYLIDATIQLGIVGALMPFLIACWPFKATKTYTSKGWSMFMNTFFVYVFMGLVVSINVQLLGQSLTGGNGGFDEIMRAINGNEVTKLKDLLDIGFSGFLVFIACCLFAFKLTGQASSLAGSMGHGGGPQIGSNIGGLAANTATKGVQGTAKFGIKTAKTVSDKTGLTSKINQGKDWLANKALGMVGLGRRSGKAGNAQARRSQMTAAAAGGAAAAAAGTPPVPPSPSGSGSSDAATPTAQSQIKKMQQTGPRSTQPATPKPQTPPSGGNNGNNAGNGGNSDNTNNSGGKGGAAKPATLQNQPSQPQNQEQLRQQLENDYNNTANGKAGQQMIQNQTAEVARNQKAENEAQGKMNYHNRRADDYLQKAQKSTDPTQKKNFEDLANAQFNEAVKAEAAYNKAKADTQRAQAELNAIKQENERYKNEFVQTEMNKRQPTQK